METLIFSLFQHPMLNQLSKHYAIGDLDFHNFPDGETKLTFHDDVKNKRVILLDSLNSPNEKYLPLIFFAETAKELGAKEVGLITPYLGYMRQDKRFNPGESVTSKVFAQSISEHFDWLITLDPHLHRNKNLNEIYSIPTKVLHATLPIAQWIKTHIQNPFVIGPDEESVQWIKTIANTVNCPFAVLNKIRMSDTKVKISLPDELKTDSHSIVLLDDMISTAHTMIETIKLLQAQSQKNIYCIATHGIFAHNAYEHLLALNIQDIVTCNTIPHETNKVDVSSLILNAL